VNRGEVWLAQAGRKRRPVLVLTRSEVLDARSLVTVAEVELDHEVIGLERDSVVNCDGLHTIAQAALTQLVGTVDEPTMERVCCAVRYAHGC